MYKILQNSTSELDELCRCCVSKHEYNVNIFTGISSSDKTYRQVLMECTSIQISTDDGMSAYICYSCVLYLESFITFCKKCVESDLILQRLRDELRFDTEPGHNTVRVRNSDVAVFDLGETGLCRGVRSYDIEIKEEYVDVDEPDATVFECELCDRRYRTEQDLEIHAREHAELSYECEQCGERIVSKSKFVEHRNVHASSEAVKLDAQESCDRTFRTHECRVCKKSFRYNHLLKEHRRKHAQFSNKRFVRSARPKRRRVDGDVSKDDSQVPVRSTSTYEGSAWPKDTRRDGVFDEDASEIIKIVSVEGARRSEKRGGDCGLESEGNQGRARERKKYVCDVCHEQFNYKNYLDEHKKSHQEDKVYSCERCAKSFRTKDILKEHRKTHDVIEKDRNMCLDGVPSEVRGPGRPKQSSKRDRTSRGTKQDRVGSDVESDTPDQVKRSYACDLCGGKFPSRSHVKRHRTVHEAGKYFPCGSCHRWFRTRRTYEVHVAQHASDEKDRAEDDAEDRTGSDDTERNTCDICHSTFKYRSYLDRHKIVHLLGNYYRCSLCDKWFRKRPQFEVHVAEHADERRELRDDARRARCATCRRVFESKYELENHVQLAHNRLVPYFFESKVAEDRKSFAHVDRSENRKPDSPDARIVNMKFPFRCGTCDSSFRYKSHLKRHELRHENERRYECDLCDEVFLKRYFLDVHKRMHQLNKHDLVRSGPPRRADGRTRPTVDRTDDRAEGSSEPQNEHADNHTQDSTEDVSKDPDTGVDFVLELADMRRILGIEDTNERVKRDIDPVENGTQT